MKVLFSMIYAPDRGGSGAPIYVRNLMQGLRDLGHSSGIVFSAPDAYAVSADAACECFPVKFKNPPIFDSQPTVTGSISFRDMTRGAAEDYLEKMKDALWRSVQNGYDLIHVQHGMYLGYAAAVLKRNTGTPYVITLHSMELSFLHEFPDPIMAKAAMTGASRIIALTQSQKERLLSEYSRERILGLDMKRSGRSRSEAESLYDHLTYGCEIDPDNVVVCPLGIDLEKFRISETTCSSAEICGKTIDKNTKIVLFAGRLLEMKGIRHLLEAEKIYNRNLNIHTVIAGGGELSAWVADECTRREMVHYLGYREQRDMPALYNFTAGHKGVFSVPSSSEGMSLSYLEAMACGLPVVACCHRNMGALDFMQPPYARFCPFGAPQPLADSISGFLDGPAMDRSSIRSRLTDYSIPRMCKDTLRIFEGVLGQAD